MNPGSRSRISKLIVVRVAVSTLLLGSAIAIEISRPGTFWVDALFLLIGLTYALSLTYFATLRFVERHVWLIDAQLGADAVLVSAFLHVTGGVTSHFSSLYFLPIISASTLRLRRGGLQVAALSALLYSALVSVQYLAASGYLEWAWSFGSATGLPPLRFAQYTVGINLFGFLAVALLSGSLAERLQSAGVKLQRASDQIADLREFNEHVIDSLRSGLVTADADGRVLTVNRAALAILGRTAAEALGRDVGEVLQIPAMWRERLRSLIHMRSLRFELKHRMADDRTIEIGLTATTLAFPNGRVGYLIAFQDITEIRRLERGARLQQRLAAVGEMAAGIAHEIRNPLASMSGSIQVLRQDLTLTDEQAELMEIVLKESERLNSTIGSFLIYARPQRFAVARLDVGAIVRETALLLRNGADVRDGHVVDVDVPAEPVWYEADGSQIRQILWNLATNGLRAMPDGGRLVLSVALDASVALEDAEDMESGAHASMTDSRAGGPAARALVITVDDEGCGIAAEELDNVFQPFHSTFEKGTGLGLAIVHRLVTDYGGTIHVSSTVGVGTTFLVRLPVRDQAVGGRESHGMQESVA